MIYLRGIAIGLGIYAFCWLAWRGGMALAESDYVGEVLAVFWALYLILVGICISKHMGREA